MVLGGYNIRQLEAAAMLLSAVQHRVQQEAQLRQTQLAQKTQLVNATCVFPGNILSTHIATKTVNDTDYRLDFI